MSAFRATLLAAAAATLCIAGAQAQTVKLTLGHGAAIGNPRHEASVKFAEAVKAKSGGRIEVQVAPSAQLGDVPDPLVGAGADAQKAGV